MNVIHLGKRSQRWVLSLLLPAFALSGQPLRANPSGGVVVHGQAVINQVSANHLQINQSSQTAIINWTDFSIGAGELTQFVQPGVNAAALNRVTGGNVSQIHGMLQGNGSVFVINTNGIVIGASGVVDVGGMTVLSTLDIDNEDFINGGPSRFYGDSQTGVTNFGTISSAQGDVVLLGGFVDNQGQIGAMNGTVALGSGGDILLEQNSSGAEITVRGASEYTGTGINNDGQVSGAAVEMKAHGNVYALAINNGNMVRATGASRSNGRVRLMASGGSSNINLGRGSNIYAQSGARGGAVEVNSASGDVTVGGNIDASGATTGGMVQVVGNNVTQTADSVIDTSGLTGGGYVAVDSTDTTTVDGTITVSSELESGGNLEVTGDQVVIGGNADLSADGFSQGGRLRVGGELMGIDNYLREASDTVVEEGASLSADSTNGNAGSVVVWANNDTLFRGDATASASGFQGGNGGLVEISGKENLTLGGSFAATSRSGEAGTVLFDPGLITVGNFGGAGGANEIEIADINDTLQNGTSVLLMTSGIGSNIFFADNAVGGNAGGAAFGGTIDTINDTIGLAYDDPNHPRNFSVQWTSDASFGAFAGGAIIVNNHIRNSGGGSINLLAGWTGTEADFEAGGQFAAGFSSVPSAPPVPFDQNVSFVAQVNPAATSIEDAFNTYLEQGQFGQPGGFISVGSSSMTRHIEVGSRYGNTNLAGNSVTLTAADTNSESRYAQIGFRDSGTVFAARHNQSISATDATGTLLDLKIGSAGFTNDPVLVGVIGDSTDGVVTGQEADLNGDGVPDGVYAIDSSGIRTDTFIPYANHYDSARAGNWWWQQIHEEAVLNRGATGYTGNNLGGNRPEMGAGSASDYANINVISTGDVVLNGGGRSQSGAYIGHGGDSAGSLEDRAERNGGGATVVDGTLRAWSANGALDGRSSNSIARLAPVYGDINVLAGVNAGAGVTVDGNGDITATIDDTGSVRLIGLQRMGSSQDPTNPENNAANGGAPVQIGHGGVGQFGQFIGDIRVEADGDIEVRAGSNSRGYAAIGHTISTFHYWNPSNVQDAQIRFFESVGAFDLPELRRDALFSGGVVEVAAAGGSTINGFHGNVTANARSGEVIVKAFDTPTAATDTLGQNIPVNGLLTYRDNRFARIGHGGSTEEVSQERLVRADEYRAQDNAMPNGVPNAPNTDRRERVILRIDNNDSQSVQLYVPLPDVFGVDDIDDPKFQQDISTRVNRALTFMTITGDVDVDAAGDVSVIAGNGNRDVAQIGHGGNALADLETSGVVVGNISIDAGGELTIIGGGEVPFTGVRENNSNPNSQQNPFGRNWAMVGHGGYTSGFLGFMGDIDVSVEGNITATAGGETQTFAKIGHQGFRDWGQTGGDFIRNENFITNTLGVTGDRGSRWSTDIETEVTSTQVTRTYTNTTAQGNATVDEVYDITTNTANVTVTSASGNILLNHKGESIRENANQLINNTNGNDANNPPGDAKTGTGLTLVDDTFTMIGHGGINSDSIRNSAEAYRYYDKIGDVTVEATAGNVTLENGNGRQRWTRIGHGLGTTFQGNGALNGDNGAFGGNSLILAGDITVNSGGNVIVNADAASATGNPLNSDELNSGLRPGIPSELNAVAIGHGAILGSDGIIVVDDDSTVNGLTASSDIEVNATGNLEVRAGKGYRGSHAQVGHGYGDNFGNSNNIRRGSVPDGFAGDISVTVGGDVLVRGQDLAWVAEENTTNRSVISVVGAFAAIGNGGYGIDASGTGDISIFAGGDVDVIAQQRTQDTTFDGGTIIGGAAIDTYAPQNSTVDGADGNNVASVYNFAKIGNFSVENEASAGTGNRADAVVNATQTGDITVVAGGNLSLQGGTTIDEADAPILGAFAQIGNGGAGIGGDEFSGDITILVEGNLNASGGQISDVTLSGLNNYAMIGNGDRVVEIAQGDPVFFGEAVGPRSGDIVIATGGSAAFNNVLVGHADPLTSTQTTSGSLQVAVSRNNPFTGGRGTLTTSSAVGATSGKLQDTVFASGSGGGDPLQLFMPARSSNQISATTRLNEETVGFTVAPANFVGLDGSGSKTSGRDDEVYLTPDLWWDAAGLAEASGFGVAGQFPTDASGSQGGSVATVSTPGGFDNITALTDAALGTSATLYRGGNGVSGTGLYTLYYDAVEGVLPARVIPPPTPPIIPPVIIPFPFIDFVFQDQFDSYERYQQFLRDGETGSTDGLYTSLTPLEMDDEYASSENSRLENGLDGLFGSSRDNYSEEELNEERRRIRQRLQDGIGAGGGLTFYAFDPGTNQYSSYRVFGIPFETF